MSLRESNFLEAITASPDDDTPRLVYADWLEELGDPRSELIRVQCRLAATPLHSAGRWELEQREEALLTTNLPRWTKLLPRFPRVPWGIEPRYGLPRECFARGLMEHVTFPGIRQYAQSFDDIWKVTPARQVRLNKWSNKAIPAFFESEGFNRIDGLWLTMDSVDVPLQQVLTIFARPELARLRKLRIFDRMLNQDGVAALLAAPLDNLRELQIDQTAAGAEQCARLAAWDRLAQVTRLQFRGNECGYEGVAALAASPHVTGIEHLDLSSNFFGDDAIEALAASKKLTSLATLDLSSNSFGQPGMRSLAASPVLKGVRRLNLSFCETAAYSLAELAASEHLTSLQHLTLNRIHDVNDAALQALAAAPALGALRRLDIDSGNYNEAGLMAVVESQHLPQLEFLTLSETCEVSDAALQKIRERFPHMRRRDKRTVVPYYTSNAKHLA